MSYQCRDCRHYLLDLECKAFPLGIPEEILEGRVWHDEVLPGQVGTYVREYERPIPAEGKEPNAWSNE